MTTIVYSDIQPKPYRRHGTVYTPNNTQGIYNAEVTPGVSVRIFGVMTNHAKFDPILRRTVSDPVHFDRVFKVGDVVEHGSYNLSYTGKITAIGKSTITIERSDIGSSATRMGLYEFVDRNYNLDLARIERENAETMQTL